MTGFCGCTTTVDGDAAADDLTMLSDAPATGAIVVGLEFEGEA